MDEIELDQLLPIRHRGICSNALSTTYWLSMADSRRILTCENPDNVPDGQIGIRVPSIISQPQENNNSQGFLFTNHYFRRFATDGIPTDYVSQPHPLARIVKRPSGIIGLRPRVGRSPCKHHSKEMDISYILDDKLFVTPQGEYFSQSEVQSRHKQLGFRDESHIEVYLDLMKAAFNSAFSDRQINYATLNAGYIMNGRGDLVMAIVGDPFSHYSNVSFSESAKLSELVSEQTVKMSNLSPKSLIEDILNRLRLYEIGLNYAGLGASEDPVVSPTYMQ